MMMRIENDAERGWPPACRIDSEMIETLKGDANKEC